LRFSELVNQADVDEAMRLMEVSRSSVDVHLDRSARHWVEGDAITRIYAYIRDLASKIEPSTEDSNLKELSYDFTLKY